MSLVEWTGYALAALALIGAVYQAISLAAMRRFFAARPTPHGRTTEAVTLLKPLHSSEPHLTENLSTFLVQDYAGPLQMVCGVGDALDNAVPAVEALRRAHPSADIALTTGPLGPGSNAKIGNLIAMMPAAKHDILIMSDSDMAVGPDYLAALLVALQQAGVGAVSCLYAGRGDAGSWSQVNAAIISWSTAPKIAMSLATGMARPCMGSTIAMRRETLERIGGFAAFPDVLADDYAIGEAIAALGLTVAIPPILLTHACREESLGDLWRQQLRWAVTIRGLAPLRHLGSGIVFALPLAMLAIPFAPLAGLAAAMTALTIRLLVAHSVDRIAGRRTAPLWLLPVADCIEFAAFLASLTARTIDWRGRSLTMAPNRRTIAPDHTQSELP
jgi:ceramide glucosyltransferase